MKVQDRVFKWQPSTWQSILCPWDKAVAQFPPKGTPLDTHGGSSVVGIARSWQLLRV